MNSYTIPRRSKAAFYLLQAVSRCPSVAKRQQLIPKKNNKSFRHHTRTPLLGSEIRRQKS